ncbi:paraquat-inducible membrane protein A [Rhodobacter sp. TJ_12]|uniref:paraquat-inducible protein A n=1 Tax=Rhodobacter sp. TJ_12 TaxID=2029399 RepID=UPI001CC02D1F|nr:paraquat-inducible protein A [Rhodobacter sp. TJ_12]MBZ4020859.1 paraquat-inducible membrane protein A [Rhodobacter sp. TJ_12]
MSSISSASATPPTLPPLETLIACPACDLLMAAPSLEAQQNCRCSRCHHLLYAPRRQTFAQVIALSLTVAILMIGAVFFPFLEISAGGIRHQSSIFDTALAFSEGILLPLSVVVMALIVVLPLLRVTLLLYTLWPLAQGRAPWRHARRAFRLAEAIQPWSMAEIFVVGAVVALVKLAGLATITLGPAFWAFGLLVIVVTVKDNLLCDWTLWKAIDTQR